MCMWRALFPMQTLMGRRKAATGPPKGRALRRSPSSYSLIFREEGEKKAFFVIVSRPAGREISQPNAQQGIVTAEYFMHGGLNEQ